MLAVVLPMHSALDVDIPCFAVELEEDIARLEAEANKDELVTFTFMKECLDVDSYTSDVVDIQDQNTHMSDADSDDGGDEREQAEVAKIRANARLVSQCGQTLQPGAWRGCCKSPWCDREDRHRGLCNHKATIAGPASRPEPVNSEEQETEEEEQDASNHDEGGCDVANSSDRGAHSDDEQQVSGGHSNNVRVSETCTRGDENEVASALQTGDMMEGVQHQHSSSQAQLQQHVAAAGLPAPLQHCSTSDEEISQDLLWGGNGGQLAAAELFNLPPAFQPRVKDLTSPGGTCLLGMDNMTSPLCDITSPLAVHAEEPHVAAAFDPTCSSDYSDHTHGKGCAHSSAHTCGASAPSSPSCASASATAADLAVFGPFKPAVMDAAPCEAAPNPAVTEQAQPAACSPYSPESAFTVITATPAVSELQDAQAAAVEAAASAVAAAAAATAAVNVAEAAAVTPQVGLDLGSTCAQATLEQAAAEGAAAEAVAAAAAAAALVASGMSPAAAMDTSLSVLQRPPRIKSKPSNSLMKAAAGACMLEGPVSPKSKKRPASSRGSSGGHCCSQCGAVSTPVWRAGPAGPKTLCNACGVRYMKVAKRK